MIAPLLREDFQTPRRWDRVWRDRPGFFNGNCPCCAGGACTNGGVAKLYVAAFNTREYDIGGNSWANKTAVGGSKNPDNGWESCSTSAVFYDGSNVSGGVTVCSNDEYVVDTWTAKTIPSHAYSNQRLMVGSVAGTTNNAFTPTTAAAAKHDQYVIGTDSWASMTNISTYHGAACKHNISDVLYCCCGNNAVGTPITGVDNFSLSLTTWASGTAATTATSSAVPLTFPTSAFLHVCGGIGGGGKILNNQRYTPGLSSWSTKTAMTNGHSQGIGYANNSSGIVSCGFPISSTTAHQLTDAYDPSGDSWSSKTAATGNYNGYGIGGI